MKIELDDQILNHPKFIRAVAKGGSAVVHLWLGLRAYCSQQLSDGFIPDDMMAEIRGPTDSRSRIKATNCLAECNLLHRGDKGWWLHDYLDHSSSRAQVLAWREANRKRKRQSRGVSQRDGERDTPRDPGCDGKCDAGVTTSGVPAPSYSSSLISDQRERETRAQADPNPATVEPSLGARRFAESLNTEAPDELEFTAEHRSVAAAQGIDIGQTWFECRDQRRAKGYRCANWQAEFLLWLRRERKFARGSPGAKQRDPPQPNDENNRYVPRKFVLPETDP